MAFSVLFYNYIVLQRGSQVCWGDFSEKENLSNLRRDESLIVKEPLIDPGRVSKLAFFSESVSLELI